MVLPKTTPSTARIMTLLFIGVLMGALDISIVGPAIPAIEETIKMNQRDVSWIFSVYILFNLIGITPISRLSDIHGRRGMYLLSVTVFALGSLIVSVSSGITVLLIGRAIQGIGSSGIFPVAVAVIGDIYPPEKRGRALGLIGAVFGLAFMMGPLIAGSLLMFFPWHVLFLINIPVAAFLIIGGYRLLPSVKLSTSGVVDWKGALFLGLFLACFTLGINLMDTGKWMESLMSTRVMSLFAMAAVFLFILILLEKRHVHPIINLRYFKNRQIRIVGLISMGLGMFQAMTVFLPKMAVRLLDVSVSRASFMLIPIVAASALASPLAGRLIDKAGSRVVIFSGLLISFIGLFLFSLTSRSFSVFYLCGALIGLGFSFRASLNYIILNEAGPGDRASAQGLLIIFISIGQLTGAALVGAVTSSAGLPEKGYHQSFTYLAGIAAILTILSIFLKNRTSEKDFISARVPKPVEP